MGNLGLYVDIIYKFLEFCIAMYVYHVASYACACNGSFIKISSPLGEKISCTLHMHDRETITHALK